MTPEILFFFHERPGALPLYERLEAQLLAEIPDAQIKVQKTQITFRVRRGFAAVSFLPVRKGRPADYITVTFGLDHPAASPRIDGLVEPYPGRWTHHVLIASPEEIDSELMAWLREAAAFSAGKR